jgi:hypothetical protein
MRYERVVLLASAAFLAASACHATDAIVAAEPEPPDHVGVCDAYGKGYFNIPGSETCLKIGGKVTTQGERGDAYNPEPDWNGSSTLRRIPNTAH